MPRGPVDEKSNPPPSRLFTIWKTRRSAIRNRRPTLVQKYSAIDRCSIHVIDNYHSSKRAQAARKSNFGKIGKPVSQDSQQIFG
jgi:hypothetical protein